ncbi:Rv3654c family TadE-like protein [Bifidobacterium jacchi]|uniref:Pilus assembly protein TadE n=1 Tax=Bifidobacterium jacchi TaxID=2490545 RepID=A0A5N5RLF1_9BIFI|nr:Rv3654c family TadE-like protein [Bifidobacterium jacchi]KAB5608166.1 pilus assembly protein TadE [Bifidobacterium jacchi]
MNRLNHDHDDRRDEDQLVLQAPVAPARRRGRLVGCDRGSGTMLAAGLAMAVGVLLAVIAAAGNALVCRTRAAEAADLAALSAAQALWDGRAFDEQGVCGIAGLVSSGNGVTLLRCATDGDDVQVSVEIATRVPFAPHIVHHSRAGPVECG